MKNILLVILLLSGAGLRASAADEISISPFGDKLPIIVSNELNVSAQAGRLTYKTSSGAKTEAQDIYLILTTDGCPAIVEWIEGGHTPNLTMQDIDSDGKKELLFYYHVGANQLVLKMFCVDAATVTAKRLTPVAEPLYSNYGSIKIIDGYVVVQNMKRISINEGVLSSQRYRLNGTKLELVDTQDRKITR